MNEVIVAVDDKYSDNNGAWQVAYVWNGERVSVTGGPYDDQVYKVDASEEQIREASEWMKKNTKPTVPFNKYCYQGRGANTYIGCLVTLKRSRKAPNGTPLCVRAFIEGGYDKMYHRYTPEQVVVSDGEQEWVVSSGCIHDVIQGVVELPFWVV